MSIASTVMRAVIATTTIIATAKKTTSLI
jgi:hypothetical protein